MKIFKQSIVLVLTLLILMSCSEKSLTEPIDTPTTVTEVVVSPDSVNVAKGFTQKFSAVVNGTNVPAQTVTWSVIDGIAETDITDDGLLTVALLETVNTLTVKATSTVDTTKSGTATVNVILPPVITSVEIDPTTADLLSGSTLQFTAIVEGENDPPPDVVWEVTGGVTGTNIDSNGLLTVATSQQISTLIVTVTSAFDPTMSASATVNVTNVTGIVISPSVISLAPGQTRRFTASVLGIGSPLQNVIWSMTGNQTPSSLDSSGLLTISNTETADTLTVTAVALADTSFVATATVRILGYIGEAGGRVFYDKGVYSDGWRYLEAAPDSTEFLAPWGLYNVVCPSTNTSIGSGQANSEFIISYILSPIAPTGDTLTATQLCDELEVNEFDDWFLPSKDELNEMYRILADGLNLGNFKRSSNPISFYWSSSAYSDNSLTETWRQRFDSGQAQGIFNADYTRLKPLLVRAIRQY